MARSDVSAPGQILLCVLFAAVIYLLLPKSVLHAAGEHLGLTIFFVLMIVCAVWSFLMNFNEGDVGSGVACVFGFAVLALIGFGIHRFAMGSPDSPKTIVFSGRVTQTNQQRWLNDRLVLVYAQDAEVGRANTQVAAFRSVIETPTDGVFSVSLPNVYSLRMADFPNCKAMEFSFKTAYCWLGDFKEDVGGIQLTVPNKRLEYAVKILPGDYEALPEEMKETGLTSLVDGNIVVMDSKPLTPSWLDSILGRKASAKPQESVPNLLVDVQNDPKLEQVEVPSQAASASLNNCNGSDTVRQSITDSKTFVREFTVQASAGIGIPVKVIEVQLGAQGGYRQKQIFTHTDHFELLAAPRTNVAYKIHWVEDWQKGVATVRATHGMVKLPFRVRVNLKSALTSEAQVCKAL